MSVLCPIISAYMVVMFARAIMSWFPIRPGTPWATIYGVVIDLTEPVLRPLRRVIPPAGIFDLSFLVAIIALGLLSQYVCTH